MRDKIIFIAAFACLMHSFSAHSQWVETTNNSAASGRAFVTIGTNIFAAVSNKGIYFSPDAGATWTIRNGAFPNIEVYSLATNGSDIFAGTGGNFGAGIFKSSDLGVSWVDISPASMIRDIEPVTALAITGPDIYMCSIKIIDGLPGMGIFKSSISGINSSSWTPFNNGIPMATRIRSLRVNGTNIYAGTYGGGVFVSSTSSSGWSATSGMATDGDYISDISFSGGTGFAGNFSGTPVLYRTINNGLSWTQSNTGIFGDKPVYAIANDSTAVYAGTEGNGVLESKDNGITWATFNEGFQDGSGNWLCNNGMAVRSLALRGNMIFAGTDCGIWKRALATSGGNPATPATPVMANDSLINIYPNPANNAITLKIPASDIGSTCTIKDASGTVIFQKQLTSETTSVAISGLATGVYFIQVGHKRGVKLIKR